MFMIILIILFLLNYIVYKNVENCQPAIVISSLEERESSCNVCRNVDRQK